MFNACISNNVPKVLFISTDKACCPINTYGACKFISEKLFSNYDKQTTHTKFVIARYGNVLESTGSLIPIVVNSIKRNEDIPLTDKKMTRFIISKEDAIQLIFDALLYGVGGEIFVKKLPSLKVDDAIDVLKEKFCATNQINIIGRRPGEKIHEVLISSDELPRTYKFGDYFVITPTLCNPPNKNKQTPPIYITQGQRLNAKSAQEFSSKQAVITKNNLTKIFEGLDSITT